LTRAVVEAAPPPSTPGPIFKTDRGRFAGTTFRAHVTAAGVQQSVTRGSAPGENAHVESFFHSLKGDLIYGRSLAAVGEVRHSFVAMCATNNHQPALGAG
jgi:putative transposase